MIYENSIKKFLLTLINHQIFNSGFELIISEKCLNGIEQFFKTRRWEQKMAPNKKKDDIEIADSLESLFGEDKDNNETRIKLKDISSNDPIFAPSKRVDESSPQKQMNRDSPKKKGIKKKNVTTQYPKSNESDIQFIDISQKNRESQQSKIPKNSSIPSTSKNQDIRGKIPQRLLNENGYFQCPPGISTIPLTRKAFEDMILVAKAINAISKERWGKRSEKLEVFMYCFAEPDEIRSGEPARISSIYIPYHQASESRVDVNEPGILDVKKYIEKTGKILLGWSHSHGHFKVYSSHTDEINHQTLLNETSNYLKIVPFQLKYIYGITINDEGQKYGVILTHYPCGHLERNVDEHFDISGEGYTPHEKEERYEELKEILEERATVIKPREGKSKEELLEELTEELIVEFLRNLNKTKDIMFNKLSETEESQFGFIQSLLDNYDNLLLDGAEETFKGVAKKILGVIDELEKGI